MNNGRIVVTGYTVPILKEETSNAVALPEGTTDIRFSLVSYQPTREKPQLGWQMFAVWTDATRSQEAKAGLSRSEPRAEWSAIELQEPLPLAGHEVGQSPGIVPHSEGPFPYVMEQSPSCDGSKRPPWATHAFLRYTVLGGGGNGGPVYVTVALEAFRHDESTGEMIPLEFA